MTDISVTDEHISLKKMQTHSNHKSAIGAIEDACLKCSKDTEEEVISSSGQEKGKDQEGKA